MKRMQNGLETIEETQARIASDTNKARVLPQKIARLQTAIQKKAALTGDQDKQKELANMQAELGQAQAELVQVQERIATAASTAQALTSAAL